MSDDSDSDSDFEPTPDALENENEDKTIKILPTSNKRKRKAEEEWMSMKEEENREIKEKMGKSLIQISNPKKLKKKHQKKLDKMMTQIFGKSCVPSSLVQSAQDDQKSSDIRERALRSVKSIQRDQKVTETRKFAGQSIQVERNVKAGEAIPSNEESKSKDVSSLDKVLSEIKGPQSISTVTKSSLDWEGYKTTEGIEEDVAAASKEGYLTRKEFLERCDYRQFEMERDDRLAKAANRMK